MNSTNDGLHLPGADVTVRAESHSSLRDTDDLVSALDRRLRYQQVLNVLGQQMILSVEPPTEKEIEDLARVVEGQPRRIAPTGSTASTGGAD